MTFCLIFAIIASATNRVANLGSVLVEANRTIVTSREIASEVSVVTESDIVADNVKSLPDALARINGIDIWHLGAGNPALVQVTMRGYGENGFGRVLVTADGENLANPDMSAANYARIPAGGIRRIEVLHGPQTVLYGDGASAGVINVVTDDNDYERKTYGEVHGGSYGTFGAAAGTRGGFEDEGIVYFADMGYDRSDGYRDNSAYDLWNLQAGIRQNFANGAFLRLSAFFSDAEYDLPGPLSESNWRNRPRYSLYSDHGHRTAYGFSFSGRGVLDDENDIRFNLAFSQRRSKFCNGDYTDIYGTVNHYTRDYESDIYSIRFAPEYHNETRLFGFSNKLIFGLEAKYSLLGGDSRDIYRDFNLEFGQNYDISRLTGGVFAQDEFFILDNLSLVIGTRLERDWNQNNVAQSGNRADNFAAGEAALNYRPVDEAKIFVRWCRFYRNPFIDEYRWSPAGKEIEITRPETGWNAELGGEWDVTDELFASGTAFYSETMNEIHLRPDTMSNENSPYLHRRQGIDLSTGWKREGTAEAKIAWTGVFAEKAEGNMKGNWVPGVPRQVLNADGRVWLWDKFDVSFGYRLIGARFAISDTRNVNDRMPAVSVFRCGARYRPEWRYLKGFTFAFTCDNLLDKNYCDYAVASMNTGANAYYPAMGRSFMFTVRYEF